MEQNQTLANQKFIPIILGASIGVYSTARSFYEAYGTISITISRALIGPINHSVIVHSVIEPDMEEEMSLVSCLKEINKAYPGIPKIVIGSDDWQVEMVVSIRDQLQEEEWIIPYTTQDVLHRVIDKSKFYGLCEELGVDYPKFMTIKEEKAEDIDLPFQFPVIIKPTSRVQWEMVKFEGKKKVFTAQDRNEFNYIITIIRNAGYLEELIIQEFIPGDDTAMHILTLYTDQKGNTKMASFGQTLIEDHTPGGIGNPVAILTFRNDEVVEQAKKIVNHAGYTGFSNFDLKYDERDGKYKFFELNPRLGRSNYYVTVGKNNPVRYYVNEYVDQKEMDYTVSDHEAIYTIVPKRLLLKSIKSVQLRNKIKSLYRQGQAKNPMYYFSVEKNLKRIFYVTVATFNYYRKFKKYPPL
ncbi:ATP-grasp domain-containing protein [Bacillaceae bacterium S4-13-58]